MRWQNKKKLSEKTRHAYVTLFMLKLLSEKDRSPISNPKLQYFSGAFVSFRALQVPHGTSKYTFPFQSPCMKKENSSRKTSHGLYFDMWQKQSESATSKINSYKKQSQGVLCGFEVRLAPSRFPHCRLTVSHMELKQVQLANNVWTRPYWEPAVLSLLWNRNLHLFVQPLRSPFR